MLRHNFANGKYTVISEHGKLYALRYGEQWRDLVGDNLIYWMLVEVENLKQQRDALLKRTVSSNCIIAPSKPD